MFKGRRLPKKYHRFTWLLGFVGFIGFRYFSSHEVADLFYFSFLSFFGLFFTAKLAAEMPDERYEENRLKNQTVDINKVLNTPDDGEFIISICDKLIVSLKLLRKHANILKEKISALS